MTIFITPVKNNNKELLKLCIKIADGFRKMGYVVDVDLMNRKLSKALKYANSINATYTVIVYEDKVVIKDMKTGDQQGIVLNELWEMFN